MGGIGGARVVSHTFPRGRCKVSLTIDHLEEEKIPGEGGKDPGEEEQALDVGEREVLGAPIRPPHGARRSRGSWAADPRPSWTLLSKPLGGLWGRQSHPER